MDAKHDDTRIGMFTTREDHPEGFTIRYEMRAINTITGGYLVLSDNQGKLDYLRFG